MKLPSLALLLTVVAIAPLAAAPKDDPNQPIRLALQAELADFTAGPVFSETLGPALTEYRRHVVTVSGDPTWEPSFSAGWIPWVEPGRPVERLGVSVYQPPTPPVGTLLFVHGYLSHAANFAYTFAQFVRQGYLVVTLDLPGHGLSTGPRGDVESFSDYGDAVAQWLRWAQGEAFPGRHILLAHSLGSAACLEALRRPTTVRPDKVVFLAPLLKVDWHPALEWGEKLLGWWWKQVPSTFGWDGYLDGYVMPVHWFTALDRWLETLDSQAPLDLPLAIYSGDRDAVVDEQANRQLYRRLVPEAQYTVLPGKGHLFMTQKRDRQAFQTQLAADLGLGSP